MVTTSAQLSQFINPSHLAARRVSMGDFANRVGRFYCPAMTAKGLCTKNCLNCKDALIAALEGIYEHAKSPGAVLVWRLRGAVAIQAENKSITEKSPVVSKDNYGINIQVDPMSALEGMYT